MTEELRELSPDMLIAKVMGNQDMMNAINDNPMKVMLSPDGTEAELSIAEVVPPIVIATVNALVEFGVINWTQDEQPPVG
jgi:hypothetical protein